MAVVFNPFTGSLDFTGTSSVPDPLTVNNLTVNTLLTATHIHGSIAGNLYIHVKNLDAAPLEKGTPFYISGTVGSSNRVEIKRADADGSGTGPAIGLVESTLAANGEGNGIIVGEIYNCDTVTPGWAINDALYVGTSGTLTTTRPTTGYRQVVGYVGRVHASTGTIIVNIKGSDAELPIVSTSLAGLTPATSFTGLTYNTTTNLDVTALNGQHRTITLTGNLTLTTSNCANGCTIVIRLLPGGSQRTLTFPVDWTFVGTKPVTLSASKTAILSLTFFGTTNADCVASYAVQS